MVFAHHAPTSSLSWNNRYRRRPFLRGLSTHPSGAAAGLSPVRRWKPPEPAVRRHDKLLARPAPRAKERMSLRFVADTIEIKGRFYVDEPTQKSFFVLDQKVRSGGGCVRPF